MAKFNAEYISKAPIPEQGQRLEFDTHRDAPRGFGLRVTKAGGKAFILKYAIEGRERRKTIGEWPTWSLEAARTEARDLRQQLDKGVDPLNEKRRNKEAPTVAEAINKYIKSHVEGLASESAIKGYFNRDLVPVIGGMKVKDVRRRDLIEVVEDKAAVTPTAARHLLAYTKGFFGWCVDREYIEASPAASIRPKSISPGGQKNALKPVKRKRVLDDDEIQSFWHGIDTCEALPLTAIAMKLVLVTGQRPGEVAGMHEDEIEKGVWTIPAERRLKTETENRVSLSSLALELIEQAKAELEKVRSSRDRRGKESGGYIFEVQPGRALAAGGLSKAANRNRTALKNKPVPQWGHWTPHDLRRTCRTGLSACGFSSEIAERVIGHAARGIEDVYNQHQYDDEKRSALEAWERRLLAIVDGQDPDRRKIVPLLRIHR